VARAARYRERRADLVEKLFLIAFGVIIAMLGTLLALINGKTEDISKIQNEHFEALLVQLNASNEKINSAITEIKVEQAKIQAKLDASTVIPPKENPANP